MSWFYNSYTGVLVHESPPAPAYFVYMADTKTGTGWHELGVADSATAAQADAWVAQNLPGGAAPLNSPGLSQTGQILGNGATNVAKRAGQALGGLFSLHASPGLVLRVAEGILGIVLICVGLARLTKAVPIATKIAGAVT